MINAVREEIELFEKGWSSDQASLVNNENYWELLGGIREWEKKICSGFLSFLNYWNNYYRSFVGSLQDLLVVVLYLEVKI